MASMRSTTIALMRVATRSVRTATATRAFAMQRTVAAPATRLFSGSRMYQHSRNDGDNDFVNIGVKPAVGAHDHDHDHEHDHDHDHEHDDDSDDEDEDDEVDVVDIGPAGVEYGGPQRGGKFKEPTRFGDWERKGRCTDF